MVRPLTNGGRPLEKGDRGRLPKTSRSSTVRRKSSVRTIRGTKLSLAGGRCRADARDAADETGTIPYVPPPSPANIPAGLRAWADEPDAAA
jgi:hypothetical protein